MQKRSYQAPTTKLLSGPFMILAASLFAGDAKAQQYDDTDLAKLDAGDDTPIVVFGRGEAKIGVAHAASEGTVAGADLLVRPLLRVSELLEAVPGMIAAQHSGSGKASQYFLRGFNLDHGSDFTTYVYGVQMNFRTHGHGQGYLDLNGLIPEIIAREDYRKGPYRADGGDFALAGAAYMRTVSSYERPWVSLEAGSFGWRRAAAGGTAHDVAGGNLTMVGETKHYDGPWQEPEHLRHYAGFLKYSHPAGASQLDLTVHGYHATWQPTEQIPERIIGSAICPDVHCGPDPSARGMTTRFIANAQVGGPGYKANVYAQYYNWSMYSNPTYADASGESAQILQFDRRWIAGARVAKDFSLGPDIDLTIGSENRLDQISRVGVDHTVDRRFVNSFGTYSVSEASTSLYGDVTWRPIAGLRVTAGLRGDYYHYSVTALDAPARTLGEGSGHAALLSPKAGLAWEASPWLEFYGNWGRGFHSNDVRGAVTVTPVPVLSRGTGYEAGARLQFSKLNLTATYWWLDVGSELRFVGDSNAVEPSGASRRRGVELVGFWRPFDWLAIDANYTASHARYDNGDYIPNAFENAAQVGVSVIKGPWEASMRLRHLGPYPLIEDNSQRDPGSNVVNFRAAWKRGALEVFGQVLNVFDSKDKDITYWYESYIPAADSAPTEGRLSRVVEPRTLRLGLRLTF